MFPNKNKNTFLRVGGPSALSIWMESSMCFYRFGYDNLELSLLSLNTGVRADEIYSLTWGNVDLERGKLL